MEAVGKQLIECNSHIITIWNLSDLHIGNAACAMDDIKRDIETIKEDPHSFFVGGGDYADYIGYTDNRFEAGELDETLTIKQLAYLGKELTRRVGDMFEPIKSKCLGLLFGNHEKKYQRVQQQGELHAELCERLGVPNLGYSALFDVEFIHTGRAVSRLVKSSNAKGQRKRFRFFVHHGAGYAATPAGKLKRLIDFMSYFPEADITMVGHVHDQVGKRVITIGGGADCDKLYQRHRIGVISGSYLKTYSLGHTTYGEVRGYAPTCLGSAIVRIDPVNGTFKGEI